MLMQWAMFVAFLASLALPVAGVVAAVTYVRKTRQQESMGGVGSVPTAILDSLDRVHVRLDAITDRLTRIEERMRVGSGATPDGLPEPDQDHDQRDALGR